MSNSIVKRILAQSGHTIRWQEGTLYPVLHHLQARGLVASWWQPASASRIAKRRPGAGRQRRYYRLTPRGHRVWREQRTQWRAFTRAINALLRG